MGSAVFVPKSLADLALEDWPIPDRDYVSASQLKMFYRCPEQFRRHYVLGEKERPAAALIWGSADHAAVEANFVQKINSYEDLPFDEIEARFEARMDERIGEAGSLSEIKWDNKQTENLTGADAKKARAALLDNGIRLVRAYHEKVAPAMQPSVVEDQFEIRVPGIPIKVKGALDLIAAPSEKAIFQAVLNGDEAPIKEESIIDRKTTGKNQMSGEWHVQRRVYQLVKPLPADFHLSVKTKEPKVIAGVHVFPVDPQAMVVAQIRRVMVGIAECFTLYGADQPWPDAMAHPWACGFCGFRETCPWWTPGAWKS